MNPYPMRTVPILKEKVWGGDRLEFFNKPVKPGDSIGESWELVSIPSTSPDGGGGDAAHSAIDNGPAKGATLKDLARDMGQQLMGNARLTSDGAFPLLAKFLDARTNLSVQVHPSPAFAARNPDAHLKTETWYILDAEPGSVIYKGIKPGVTESQFKNAINNDTVGELMNALEVKPGDTHHMPSGICHALGKGVLVAEIQMPSDTTFRVYDWGREGRTLHIDQAMQCLSFPGTTPEPGTRADDSEHTPTALERNEHYAIVELRSIDGETMDVELPRPAPTVLMCVEGAGSIEPPTPDAFDPVPFRKGDTFLLPASLTALRLDFARDTTLLDVTIQPDA